MQIRFFFERGKSDTINTKLENLEKSKEDNRE